MADLLKHVGPQHIQGLFLHTANLWEIWSDLTEVVKSGKSRLKTWSEKKSIDLALTMQQQAKKMAAGLVDLVDCTHVKKMLDLGSGPGSYSIAFARCYSKIKIVCFDNDERANLLALQEIRKQQLQERITLIKGDLFVNDFGKGYDLILLSSVICLLGKKEISGLFKKIKGSLNYGGRVVIWDLIPEESKTHPVATSIFAVNMLLTTNNGQTYSFSEVRDLLQSTGFKDIYRIPYNQSQIIIGSI